MNSLVFFTFTDNDNFAGNNLCLNNGNDAVSLTFTPSYQDVLNPSPTEIDAVNGAGRSDETGRANIDAVNPAFDKSEFDNSSRAPLTTPSLNDSRIIIEYTASIATYALEGGDHEN